MASHLPNFVSSTHSQPSIHILQPALNVSEAAYSQATANIFTEIQADGTPLAGRVTAERPFSQKEQLLEILKTWNPGCCESEKIKVRQHIINCFDQNMKCLLIRNQNIQSLPDIFSLSHFRELRAIDLSNCISLSTLPESISSLPLVELRLDNCRSLSSLPESIGNLKFLRRLYMSFCNSMTTLPNSIGDLIALETLIMGSSESLASLPETLGNLPAISEIDLSCCSSFTTCPESIGRLETLESLDMSYSCSLTALPNSILNLSSDCVVDVTGCGLSDFVRNRLRESTRISSYRGPRIHFSLPDLAVLASRRNLEDSLKELFQNANVAYEPLPHLLSLEESEKNKISLWINRLADTADANSSCREGFYRTILSYLRLTHESPDFRGVFLQVLEDASRTCGDRVALSALQLGIEHKKTTCDRTNLKALAQLLKGMKALELLELVAKEKVRSLKFVDEIEVYLAYPIKLKDELNLPIDIQEMRFFTCSGITPEDLTSAKEFVLSIIDNQEALLAEFVKNEDWVSALKGKYPTEFEEIKRARDIAANLEEPNFIEIQQIFLKKLVALSRNALL